MRDDEFVRFLAAWALVHETADEGWKAAVARGKAEGTGALGGGPGAFVDGLSALVAEEKERLKAELAAGTSATAGGSQTELAQRMDEVRFEVAELRGRIETLQASVDALLGRAEG